MFSERVARFLETYMMMNSELKRTLFSNIQVLNTVKAPVLLTKVAAKEGRTANLIHLVSGRSVVATKFHGTGDVLLRPILGRQAYFETGRTWK